MNIHDTIAYQNIGLPDDILRRKLHGDFPGALRLIDRRMADPLTPQSMKYALEFQKEILRRIPDQYPYTREEALAILREHIADFSEEELDELLDERRIRWIYDNGEMKIFGRFFSTLCKAMAGFAERANKQTAGAESAAEDSEEAHRLDRTMEKMKAAGSQTIRIRVRAALKLKDEHFTPGMFLRAHLPIPKACDQQSDIRIETLFPENGHIAPEDAPQRTVCWEETMEENHEFIVEYSYLHTAKFTDAYHLEGKASEAAFDTEEKAPHIVFTPYIKALCAELTSGLIDPLAKARAIYDFITKTMNYTFMPDYFVMENIPDTCAREHTGDCGVFALLFITLCRCAGIPAQWQSGMSAEPFFIGAHDWARFYVEPYGWLYADPSYGISAMRNGNEARRRFYFGNLDPYRMVANSQFQENFTIPKAHWRADPYDNQTGEMESSDHGFLYSEYIRDKDILLCQEV